MPRGVRPPSGVGTITGEFDLGTYGVLGGEIELLGNWLPGAESPQAAADDMLRLSGYLDDVERPLLSSAQIARHDTEERFDTETDPDGTEWAKLDADYAEHKHSEGFTAKGASPSGDFILRLSNKMRDKAVAPGAWVVHGDTLVFDPAGLPFYAYMHQVGSGTENVGIAATHRNLVRFERETGTKLGEGPRGGQKDNLGIGRGNALPARPFIGLSEEAINEITSVFDLWFEEGIEGIFIHPKTNVAQLRNPLGQFGARI